MCGVTGDVTRNPQTMQRPTRTALATEGLSLNRDPLCSRLQRQSQAPLELAVPMPLAQWRVVHFVQMVELVQQGDTCNNTEQRQQDR